MILEIQEALEFLARWDPRESEVILVQAEARVSLALVENPVKPAQEVLPDQLERLVIRVVA